MAAYSVDWKMKCNVNGVDFQLNGMGTADVRAGLNEMRFAARGAPVGFDPVSCPMICNAPLTSFIAAAGDGHDTLLALTGGRLQIAPARVGRVHDASGRELLNLAVETTIALEQQTLVVRNRMHGYSRLPELARNRVPVWDALVPNGPGSATGVVRFELETRAGEILQGSTLIPYRWNGPALPAVWRRAVEQIDVVWNGFEDIRATVRSRWASEARGDTVRQVA